MPADHTNQDRFQNRRRKLIRTIRAAGADALLVTNFTNVSYLTGFSGDDSYLFEGGERATLVSDGRYATQIQEECPDLDVYIRTTSQSMIDAVCHVAGRVRIGKLGFESSSATYELWEALHSRLKKVELVPTVHLVEDLRLIKDRGEVSEIRKAIRQAERGFGLLRAWLVAGTTERQAADELVHAMKQFGAIGASFEPIVAAGPRAALPHARASDGEIRGSGFVLVDWGATAASGYKSDLTRVLTAGKILPKLVKIYRVVLKAQRQAIDAIRPGVRCSDVDAAARRVIEEAGYAKKFTHSLGHGIGLDIHESPRLSPRSEAVLKPGMVATVEPGIYLPGWGGVRIEDDVLVTRNGCEVLSSLSTDLEGALFD